MEREHMRRILAEGMGWKKMYLVEWETEVWMEPSGQKDSLGLDGWLVVKGMYDWRDFKPWESWSQCGLVIEAMYELGWTLVVTYSPTGPWVKYHKTDEQNHYHWATSDEPADDLCAEICEVAARALEASDG